MLGNGNAGMRQEYVSPCEILVLCCLEQSTFPQLELLTNLPRRGPALALRRCARSLLWFDILVETEHVRWVVFGFDFCEALVVLSVSVFYERFAIFAVASKVQV